VLGIKAGHDVEVSLTHHRHHVHPPLIRAARGNRHRQVLIATRQAAAISRKQENKQTRDITARGVPRTQVVGPPRGEARVAVPRQEARLLLALAQVAR